MGEEEIKPGHKETAEDFSPESFTFSSCCAVALLSTAISLKWQ